MAYRKRRRGRNRNRDPLDLGAPLSAATDAEPAEERAEEDQVPIGQSDLPGEVADAEDLEAVHKEAVDRYQVAWEKERRNQADAYDDLRFISEDDAQWDAQALRSRREEQRPILTVNKCPQFVRQVTGDIRQLRPSIHVVPVDEKATDQLAMDVLPELVRYVERRSDAKAAYFSAADQMVAGGVGHVRVFTEYAAGTTMNQEIGIGLIQDGIAVVWDPDAIHPTRKDANYCFVPIDMAHKAAEQRWPDKAFDAPLSQAQNHEAWNGWHSDDAVRITEYWRKAPMERELAIYPDGRIIDITEDEGENEGTEEGTEEGDTLGELGNDLGPLNLGPAPGMPPPPVIPPGTGPKRADAIVAGAKFEKRDSYRVERYIMAAGEILEGPEDWPGMQIPIVPFLGEEVKIGRQTVRRGIVRVLKDVQRLYNYAVSADAEAVALQPKAPFKGTRKNFENFKDQWETANSRNWPFLEYDPDPLNSGRPPEREPPPVASSGIKELLAVASQDMSAVTGIYPSSLGAPAQETSGRAIVARQREGDTGTFLYIEAFGRAVERTGQIVVDLIPHIYDVERTLRVVGDDGKMTRIDINKPVIDPNGDGIDTITMNDVTLGAYQVSVEMGPSYSTKREEARDGMQTLMQALGPQAAPLFADLFVKGQDFPLSDEIAERLQHMLPPQIQQAEAQKSGKPPPPPQPPPPPNPEIAIKQGDLQLRQQEMQSKAGHEDARLQLEDRKLQQELQIEMRRIQADLEKARMATECTMLSHQVKVSGHTMDYATAERDRAHEAMMGAHDRAHEAGMGMQDRAHEAGMGAMDSMMNGMNGNGAGAEPAAEPDDSQQQQQIDALIDAVGQLQMAVGQIAQMVGGGAPRPPAPPPGPPPMPPMGPPPGPPAGPPGPPPGPPPVGMPPGPPVGPPRPF